MKHAHLNILESSIVSLSAGTEDSDFPLYRLYDRNVGRLFKPTAAETIEIKITPNELINPGLETGDFTGWAPVNSAIDSTTFRSGAYSARLIASGSAIDGARQDVPVDPTKVREVQCYGRVGSYVAGTYQINILQMDSDLNYITGTALTLVTLSANSGFVFGGTTIGPSGSGAAHTFAPGAAYIRKQHKWSGAGSEGVGWMDDVVIMKDIALDRLLIPAGHNLGGMTLDIKYSDDDITYTPAVAQFTAPDGVIDKSWTGLTKPFWKFIITSPSRVPEIPELFLTATYEWARNPSRPAGDLDEKFNVESALTAGGQDRFLVMGDSKRQRSYKVPRMPEAMRDALLALNDAWKGAHPFWLHDHTGEWIYGKLARPMDVQEVAQGSSSLTFDFREVLP